jgi:hypothetical protein
VTELPYKPGRNAAYSDRITRDAGPLSQFLNIGTLRPLASGGKLQKQGLITRARLSRDCGGGRRLRRSLHKCR